MSKFSCVFFLNLLAILILLSALNSMHYHRFRNLLKTKIFFASIFMCVFASLICILLHYNLTKETLIAHYIVLACITTLYFIGMMIPVAWLSFLILHLYNDEDLLKKNLKFILIPCIIIEISLIFNLFFGFYFSVSPPPQNSYMPTDLIAITGLVQFAYVLASVIIYYNFKRSSELAFFSISIFFVPIIAVFFTSTLFSQRPVLFIGTEWPFVAVVLISLCFSLQNELAFKDHLTQLYNRDYLDIIKMKFLNSNASKSKGAILIDVNNFKGINDNFGHEEGDKALVKIANSIKKAIFKLGVAVRYGGDEFIVFINSDDKKMLENIINKVNKNLSDLNRNSPYELSFAAGFDIFMPKNKSIDDVLKILDQKMYENKRISYALSKMKDKYIKRKSS